MIDRGAYMKAEQSWTWAAIRSTSRRWKKAASSPRTTLRPGGGLPGTELDQETRARWGKYLQEVDAGMQERINALNKSVPYNPPPR